MAAFSTMSDAETRAKAKIADGTWMNAYAGRDKAGAIVVTVQRKMASTSDATRSAGAWVEISDDATV